MKKEHGVACTTYCGIVAQIKVDSFIRLHPSHDLVAQPQLAVLCRATVTQKKQRGGGVLTPTLI